MDPSHETLYYTNYGDPFIHAVFVNDGGLGLEWSIAPTLPDGQLVSYGALSWQPTPSGGVLWGGRYDGSGAVDRINPVTGAVTPAFTFHFPTGDSCYDQPSGYIDGLASDPVDQTLWLGDDAARTVYHVTQSGVQLAEFSTPAGYCRSGIAVSGSSGFLWFGLMSGPDAPPYLIGLVSKTHPATLMGSIDVPSGGGAEGLAVDPAERFPSTLTASVCALWTNQFGASTVLTAWHLPTGLCQTMSAKQPESVP